MNFGNRPAVALTLLFRVLVLLRAYAAYPNVFGTATVKIRFIAVEPAESAVLSGGPTGAHKIDGIGAGYVVPLWHTGIADEITPVSTDEARSMAFRMAREEGLFCGLSTGANVVAALRLAERLGPDATVVTMMCDSGMKYLTTFSKNLEE